MMRIREQIQQVIAEHGPQTGESLARRLGIAQSRILNHLNRNKTLFRVAGRERASTGWPARVWVLAEPPAPAAGDSATVVIPRRVERQLAKMDALAKAVRALILTGQREEAVRMAKVWLDENRKLQDLCQPDEECR